MGLCELATEVLIQFTPESRVTALAALLSNIAGNIPDDEWARMEEAVDPCGIEGCKCHFRKVDVMDLATMLRDYHKENTQ